MDIYSHELSAYKMELESLRSEICNFSKVRNEHENLTHFSLGVSNRGHLIVVGLCSLVEAFLYELASEEENNQSFKLGDLRGSGLTKLKNYLSRAKRVDFGKINDWGNFKNIYTLRNTLVHSYGGLIESSKLEEAKKALKTLNIESSLVGDRRIRLDMKTLFKCHAIVENVVVDLKKHTQ